MTLDQICTKVLAKLVEEAGSSDFWSSTEIKSNTNDLYKMIATEFKCIKKRMATSVSVAGTARYLVTKDTNVDFVLKLFNVSYDGSPVDFWTVRKLNDSVHKWRALSQGTPWGWFFDLGDEPNYVTFVPAAGTSALEIAYEYAYSPIDLTNSDSPETPLTDGAILIDGVMSMSLAKSGGGRDLDRSDWYWQQFISKLGQVTEARAVEVHRLGSIEDVGIQSGPRLPSNYPTYPWGE